MTPPLAPKNQSSFDNEISLLDFIQFFKANFKRILFFIVLGGTLGDLYGKLASPIYQGSVLISPAKVAGNLITEPKVILTKLNMNTYYSKETFLACNPGFYKDKDKDIDYGMSDLVKASITKDGDFIELKMNDSNKETIHACLNHITQDMNTSQKIITDLLIEFKKTELNLIEEKLKVAEEFHGQLNDIQLRKLKTNELRFLTDVLYANIAFNNANEIKKLLDESNKVKTELSSQHTNEAGKVLPINIERKSFPSLKLGLLLGGVLGFFISLFRHMKID